jgi:hypothetical protein
MPKHCGEVDDKIVGGPEFIMEFQHKRGYHHGDLERALVDGALRF